MRQGYSDPGPHAAIGRHLLGWATVAALVTLAAPQATGSTVMSSSGSGIPVDMARGDSRWGYEYARGRGGSTTFLPLI